MAGLVKVSLHLHDRSSVGQALTELSCADDRGEHARRNVEKRRDGLSETISPFLTGRGTPQTRSELRIDSLVLGVTRLEPSWGEPFDGFAMIAADPSDD